MRRAVQLAVTTASLERAQGDPAELYLRISHTDALSGTPHADTLERWEAAVLHAGPDGDEVAIGSVAPAGQLEGGDAARSGGGSGDHGDGTVHPITLFRAVPHGRVVENARTMEQHESTTAASTPEQVGLSFLTLAHGLRERVDQHMLATAGLSGPSALPCSLTPHRVSPRAAR